MNSRSNYLLWLILPVAIVLGCLGWFASTNRNEQANIETPLQEMARQSGQDVEPDLDRDEEAGPTYHGKEIVETYLAKVVEVCCGDTIRVRTEDELEIEIRIDSIDAPEADQPFGVEAKLALAKFVFGNTVEVHKTGEDELGRTLAFLMVDDLDVSSNMVIQGNAWEYVEYSKSPWLKGRQEIAKSNKAGLWRQGMDVMKYPIAPWVWRKNKDEGNQK